MEEKKKTDCHKMQEPEKKTDCSKAQDPEKKAGPRICRTQTQEPKCCTPDLKRREQICRRPPQSGCCPDARQILRWALWNTGIFRCDNSCRSGWSSRKRWR